MYRFLISIFIMVLPMTLSANESRDHDARVKLLLARLDSAIEAKPEAMKQKQNRIDFLISKLGKETNTETRLGIYEDLYREYYVYNYDMADKCLDDGLKLARSSGAKYYIQRFIINKVELLSIAGLYLESEKMAAMIDSTDLVPRLKFDYYVAMFNLNRYIADYCNDSTYTPNYRAISFNYLVRAIHHLPDDPGIRYYYLGDWATFVRRDLSLARHYYLKSLKSSVEDSRIYSMACYVLGTNNLKAFGKAGMHAYEEYLIKAAISDARCLTMENLAPQKLAIFFYQQGKGDIDRAQRYITQALDDAKFYKNRLRIIEISQNLPTIINHYQGVISQRNKAMTFALIAVSVLVLVLFAILVLFYRQNKRLIYSRLRQKEATTQLIDSYKKQELLNTQLTNLNSRLRSINHRHDELGKLFIDLCDKYITRLGKYQTLVKRKLKAGQSQQLLAQVDSTKLPEEDAEIFYHKFDEAFLAIYPTFVDEFNNLLRDDEKVIPKQQGTLTKDLRVFALIRLGVKESSEISNLLFYSSQTIYNYRSKMKSHAKNRDTFEDDVRQLCSAT